MLERLIPSRLLRRLAAFRDDTRGTVAVEAAVIFPMVLWGLLGTFVYFEGYRQTSINHKAANTIADMLSRETQSLTPTYITNTKALFDQMAQANGDTRIRLSVIKWSNYHESYRVVWSQVRGDEISSLTHDDVIDWQLKLPQVPDQERIILVETWSTYNPLFRIGMDPVDIQTFVFTRLRFSPQLRFCDYCS
jgi:hypothetical protein